MVDADKAGVVFSIDPVSNCYDEAVVSASRGLGEQVVQGTVETDVFTLDKDSGRLVSHTAAGSDPCLSQGQLKALLDLVKAVEADVRRPVDIEWAFRGGALHLLQARPVTAWLPLPPEMVTKPGEPKKLFANSTLIEQGIEGSLSALGADFLTLMLKSMAGSLGKDGVGIDGTAFTAGGRYYMHVSNAVRLGGRKMAFAPGSMGDETVSAILDSIDLEQYLPRELPPTLRKMKLRMPLVLLAIGLPTLRALFSPEGLMAEFRRESPAQEAAFFLPEREGESLAQRGEYLAGLLDFYNIRFGTPFVLAAQLAYRKIQRLFSSEGEAAKTDIVRLAQALPDNPTAQMGMKMQRLAQAPEIRESPTEEEFLARLSEGRFGEAFMAEWNCFIQEFGHRAPKEIDAATPR
ncbi:MAG: pps2, partial [Spirochaetes bacterium]